LENLFSKKTGRGLKRLIVTITVVALAAILATGCGPTAPPPSSPPGSQVKTPGGSLGISAQPNPGGDPGGRDVNYISPAKVEMGNLTPGATGEFELEVHNGRDEKTLFIIGVREPDYVAAGFERLPPEYYNWIKIAETNPELGPKESRFVMVSLTMPPGAKYSKKSAEIWISVKEAAKGDATVALQIELACRLMITTG
jgi:hypothetical protein